MSPSADIGPYLTGRMCFLDRDPIFEIEKPYTVRYVPDPMSGVAQSNIKNVHKTLQFHDMRGREDLVYEKCGFTVVKLLQDEMTYDDFAVDEKIQKVQQGDQHQ